MVSDCSTEIGAYSVRDYGREVGDYQMVSAWVGAHSEGEILDETLLPPIGVIIERDGRPLAACWMHLSVGIGVAFMDNPVTAPGLPLQEAKGALVIAHDVLTDIAKAHGYGLMSVAAKPAVARYLERTLGFARVGDRVQLTKRID